MAAEEEEGAILVLPGDTIDHSNIPSHPKKPLRLGPGMRSLPPSTILPTVPGRLCSDKKKNKMWIEHNPGRYVPHTNDKVVGQVRHSASEHYYVSLSPYTPNSILPHLAFENATKKTRPQLANGALVYARVALANKHMDVEIECVDATTGKADGLGPLNGGMVYSISLALARRLSMGKKDAGKVFVLEELGDAGLAFEVAIGANGKVWVGGDKIADIILVGRALTETDDQDLGPEGQRALVRRLLRERK